MKEVGHVHTKSVGDEQEVAEFRLGAGFHALDRRPVQPGLVSQGFLRHVEPEPAHADAIARGPAGIENPLGLVGRHADNRFGTMIVCQQQICGIFRSWKSDRRTGWSVP